MFLYWHCAFIEKGYRLQNITPIGAEQSRAGKTTEVFTIYYELHFYFLFGNTRMFITSYSDIKTDKLLLTIRGKVGQNNTNFTLYLVILFTSTFYLKLLYCFYLTQTYIHTI